MCLFRKQLQESRCFKKRIRRLEDANKKLALELEHEKGKLAGLGTSHNALKEHANVLEAALAKREADLVQLNLQVGAACACFFFFFFTFTYIKIYFFNHLSNFKTNFKTFFIVIELLPIQ